MIPIPNFIENGWKKMMKIQKNGHWIIFLNNFNP